MTEKLKNSFKSPEGAYQTPEPNTFLQSHQNKQRPCLGRVLLRRDLAGVTRGEVTRKGPECSSTEGQVDFSRFHLLLFLNSLGSKGP